MYKTYYTILFMLFLACSKDAMLPPGKEPIQNNDIVCEEFNEISDFIWDDMDLGGGNKIIMRHTSAVRRMARSGNPNDLRKQLCNYKWKPTSFLKTGHLSDINRIGFAPQTEFEGRWIIAMYHPNNYPDHFIIYDKTTKDWVRWEENGRNPRIYSKGNGD